MHRNNTECVKAQIILLHVKHYNVVDDSRYYACGKKGTF